MLKVMAQLGAMYPGYELKTGAADLYAKLLADVPDVVLEAAAQQHMAESRFFPTAAELRQQALKIGHRVQGYVDGDVAYMEVQDYYDSGGAQKPSNRFVLEALRYIGGIHAIRTSENPNWTRKTYVDTYNAMVAHAREHQDALPAANEVVRRLSIERARREAEYLPAPKRTTGESAYEGAFDE